MNYLKKEANLILNQPLLERKLQGFRLLAISRAMVERMGILCMVYRIDKEPKILDRINQELSAVCAFKDWNNQHFLDVAEMSFAVALALDWVGEWLPGETVKTAKTSLINKGLYYRALMKAAPECSGSTAPTIGMPFAMEV